MANRFNNLISQTSNTSSRFRGLKEDKDLAQTKAPLPMTPFQPPVQEKKYSPFDSVSQTKYPSVMKPQPSPYQFGTEKPQVPEVVRNVATNQKNLFNEGTKEFEKFGVKSRALFQPLEDVVRKPFLGAAKAVKTGSDAPLKILNTPVVKKAMGNVAQRTSGTGIISMIQAAGPEKTFQEAYEANRQAQAGDDSKLNQFLYQLGDTLPQTAFGVALNFVPYAGVPLSTAYWTALSANEQVQNKGEVESLRPVAIDVLGDRMLGNSIRGLFKGPATSLKKTLIQNFGVEGGTEVSQDLLKFQDAYLRAETEEEKAKIIEEAKQYFTSGQILMTAGVGGISGSAVAGGAHVAQQTKELHESMTPGERQSGFIKNPLAPEEQPSEEFPIEDYPEAYTPMEAGEDIQQRAQESLPPDMASTIEPLQKVMEGDNRTPINQRIRWVDYLRTPYKVYRRMGIRSEYEKVLKGYENYSLELPGNIDEITEWSKRVSPESNERIFRFLDGEKILLDQEESKVASEVKAKLAYWADRLGISADSRISEYITHIFPLGKGGEIPEEISLIINKKIPGSVYNPFLLQRQGAEGYLKDTWKAMDAYTKRATRKANMDDALGELKESVDKLTDTSQINFINKNLGAINLRPTELDTAIDNHILETFGYRFGTRPTASITKGVRRLISRAKIGGSIVSFAKNLTQGVNTFAELGPTYTTIGYKNLVQQGAEELNEQGVLISPFVEDRAYSAVKKAAEKFDTVLFANMNASELVNRGAAYYGAKAKYLKGNITPKEVKQGLNKDVQSGYEVTEEDAKAYGKYVANRTQFKFSPVDTPVGLSSDIAKTSMQFQTFGLKQTEFMMSMLGQKEYLKFTRYMVSSMLMFSFIGQAFGMSWDDSFKTLRFGKPPALQFIMDLWNKGVFGEDKYGNKLTPGERVTGVGESLFTNMVPAGAQAKRGYEGVSAVNEGVSRTKGGNFQYKIDKTPMNYARAALFGKHNLPEAKEYYDKQEKKKKGKASSGSNRFKGL